MAAADAPAAVAASADASAPTASAAADRPASLDAKADAGGASAAPAPTPLADQHQRARGQSLAAISLWQSPSLGSATTQDQDASVSWRNSAIAPERAAPFALCVLSAFGLWAVNRRRASGAGGRSRPKA